MELIKKLCKKSVGTCTLTGTIRDCFIFIVQFQPHAHGLIQIIEILMTYSNMFGQGYEKKRFWDFLGELDLYYSFGI